MRQNKKAILLLMGPAVLLFSVFTLYPVIRTIIMSFFNVNTVTSPTNTWKFVGLQNYVDLFQNPIFRISMKNIVWVWLFTGIGTIGISLIFAVILHSNIKGKSLFRSSVYLPEVISPIAIGYAWLLYAFNSKFGLFHRFFSAIGLDSLANIQWTNPQNIFYAMVIAAIFGAVGKFALMYLSAMEKIPKDYYEVARIEGQGAVQQFFTITLPLISSVLKSSLVLFTTATIGFFVFSQVFSGISTITPMVFTYTQIFGTEINPHTNVGVGAASGVMMTLVGMFFFLVVNFIMKDPDYEY